jgi:hypothetical protein
LRAEWRRKFRSTSKPLILCSHCVSPLPPDLKNFYLKLLENIETLLRSHASAQRELPDSDQVQDLKELWEIVANQYREGSGEEPPLPFWNVRR